VFSAAEVMIEESGVNIKIPRQNSRQTKRQNYFDADIFLVWTFGESHFILFIFRP